MSRHIIIDLGASSGRVLSGTPDGVLYEHARFKVNSRICNNRLRWDIAELLHNIADGLEKAAAEIPGSILSISCDSWSQDFVLLDKNGDLIDEPVCYRDELIGHAPELLKKCCINIPGKISTLHQLAVMQKFEGKKLAQAATLMHIADYINYTLCGKAACNYSMLAAGKLLDSSGKLDLHNLEKLSIDPELFPAPASGEVIGFVQDSSPEKLRGVPVVSGVSHDTASAFIAETPMPDSAVVILGTWAMAGIMADPATAVNKEKLLGITPELAAYSGGTAGMWALNSCIDEWKKAGIFPGFAEFDRQCAESNYPHSYQAQWSDTLIVPAMIKEYFLLQNLPEPATLGDYGRALNLGIARSIAELLKNLQKDADAKLNKLIVCGGGSQSAPLLQALAQATNCSVCRGAVEATAIGNLRSQKRALAR